MPKTERYVGRASKKDVRVPNKPNKINKPNKSKENGKTDEL